MIQNASVADHLFLDSLPDETRAIIARVYGDIPTPGGYTAEDMREAFEAGFEEAAEQFERPWLRSADFDYWLQGR